jgi:hypothetical protein
MPTILDLAYDGSYVGRYRMNTIHTYKGQRWLYVQSTDTVVPY